MMLSFLCCGDILMLKGRVFYTASLLLTTLAYTNMYTTHKFRDTRLLGEIYGKYKKLYYKSRAFK